MFTEAEKIIAKIAIDCPKTAEQLLAQAKALDEFRCSIKTAKEVTSKDDMFDMAREIIKNARDDCPNHDDDFDELGKLLDAAAGGKCGS